MASDLLVRCPNASDGDAYYDRNAYYRYGRNRSACDGDEHCQKFQCTGPVLEMQVGVRINVFYDWRVKIGFALQWVRFLGGGGLGSGGFLLGSVLGVWVLFSWGCGVIPGKIDFWGQQGRARGRFGWRGGRGIGGLRRGAFRNHDGMGWVWIQGKTEQEVG